MRNILRIISLIAIALLAGNAQARTVEIKMSQCPKPYVDNLRKMTESLRGSDELILNFDKPGKYEFDGSIKFRCNTVIKGISPEATKVIVREGFASGKSKMQDDVFFAIHGSTTKKVKAEIRDISFELASHNGILWENAAKHIVKIWHGDGIIVDNIVSKTRDAANTNLDLRECSNVLVQNSEFENYNNCNMGGNLWSRGKQNNIVVKNNVFRKYGNDEVLAFWGGRSGINDDSEMKDIVVKDNQFYYGNKAKSKKDIKVSVFICFYHFQEDVFRIKNRCYVDNIVFKNNSITIDDVIYRDISFNFDSLASVGNIEISNNSITNTRKSSSDSNYMNDITLVACGNIQSPVIIKNNTVNNHGEVLCNGKNSGYTFLSLKGVDVNLNGNVVNSDYGVGLLWCHAGLMNITMQNNTATGLYKTGILGSSEGTSKINIIANANTLDGDTRLYCENLDELTLNFTNNTFNSSASHFFLQEGAPKTWVVFDGNTINALKGKGIMFANYSNKPYNFTKIQVTNNTFRGLSKNAIENPFKSARNKTINNNIYR